MATRFDTEFFYNFSQTRQKVRIFGFWHLLCSNLMLFSAWLLPSPLQSFLQIPAQEAIFDCDVGNGQRPEATHQIGVKKSMRRSNAFPALTAHTVWLRNLLDFWTSGILIDDASKWQCHLSKVSPSRRTKKGDSVTRSLASCPRMGPNIWTWAQYPVSCTKTTATVALYPTVLVDFSDTT